MFARPTPWLAALAALSAIVIACNVKVSDDNSNNDSPEATGATDSTDTAGVSGGYLEGDPCSASEECEGDLVCVAPYDSGAETPLGEAVCVAECVQAYDLVRYCFDDTACCDELHCSLDGLCEPDPPETPDETETGESSTDDETGTETGTGTG